VAPFSEQQNSKPTLMRLALVVKRKCRQILAITEQCGAGSSRLLRNENVASAVRKVCQTHSDISGSIIGQTHKCTTGPIFSQTHNDTSGPVIGPPAVQPREGAPSGIARSILNRGQPLASAQRHVHRDRRRIGRRCHRRKDTSCQYGQMTERQTGH